MKALITKTGKVIFNLLVVVFALIAILTALTAYSLPVPWKLFIVQSGSMQPSIQPGSLVLTAPQNEYYPDEVITYKIDPSIDMKAPNATLTHRILEVNKATDGSKIYITKGDDNDNPDSSPVTEIQVVGRVVLTIPWLGKVLSFTKTQLGLVLVIVIPASWLIYSELLTLKKEIRNLLAKKKSTESENSDD